jgi:hypothetical protein
MKSIIAITILSVAAGPAFAQSRQCEAGFRVLRSPLANDFEKQAMLEMMRNRGCFRAPPPQPTPRAAVPSRNDPETMIKLWHEANSQCRGGPGDQKATLDACEEREAYGKRLGQLGWCYGKPGEAGYQMKWHQCAW